MNKFIQQCWYTLCKKSLYYINESYNQLHYFINSCRKKSNVFPDKKGNYSITYIIHDKEYIIPLKLSHSPLEYEILNVYTEPTTDNFEKYIGPNMDFHGLKLTPKKLGLKKVIITLFDSTSTIEKIFNENDILLF